MSSVKGIIGQRTALAVEARKGRIRLVESLELGPVLGVASAV